MHARTPCRTGRHILLRPDLPASRAWLLALLAAASACVASGGAAGGMAGGLASESQQMSPPPLPPLSHSAVSASTACVLAGGWCPAHQQDFLLAGKVWDPSNLEATGTAAGSNSSSGGSSTLPAKPPPPLPPGPRPHKPLFPLSGWDVAGAAVAGLALLLAASGGIGGGAILVPLFILVLGFGTSHAVALSNVTIVGGTVANLAFNVGRRHPLRQAPLIDWDLIMVMEPSTILGALAGGYLNKVLPGWLTTVTLSLLLILISYKLVRKALDIRRKERRALHSTAQHTRHRSAAPHSYHGSAGGDASLRTPLLHGAAVGDVILNDTPSPTDQREVPRGSSSGREAAWEDEETGSAAGGGFTSALPQTPTAVAVAVSVGGATESSSGLDSSSFGGGGGTGSEASGHGGMSPTGSTTPLLPGVPPLLPPKALKGRPGIGNGKNGSSHAGNGSSSGSGQAKPAASTWQPHLPWAKVGVLLLLLAGVVASDILKLRAPCPSLSYWLRATAMIPVTLAVLFAVRAYLLAKGSAQRAAGHEAVEGDVAWTAGSTLLYPALCTFAGLAAGVFGVGGGIIKGPLMLEMGVIPEVAAATSATMIFFTASAASVVFISFGAVQWDYAIALLALGCIATSAGHLLVMWVNRHVQSRSLLVFVMAVVLGISAVAMAAQGALATSEAARAHDLWRFHDVCGHAS